jgi:hypothetical protein
MSSASNDNGRALEYCLVARLVELNPAIALLGNTVQDQQRDVLYFRNLSQALRDNFIKGCDVYIDRLDPMDIFSIERLNDQAAVHGDVTDIKIIYRSSSYINVSCKSNHDAVKHQRPGALISNQLKNTDPNLDSDYRANLDSVYNDFYSQLTDEKTIPEIKANNPAAIHKLYSDVCNLVVTQLNNSQQQHVQNYFNFLLGYHAFEKFIVYSDRVEISYFNNITLPTSMCSAVKGDSYINLRFNNGFEFSLRIHTASSRFQRGKAPSLKFDTRLTSSNIQTDIISLH